MWKGARENGCPEFADYDDDDYIYGYDGDYYYVVLWLLNS